MSYTPRIGLEVVCIKKGAWNGDSSAVRPVSEQVYMIRDIHLADNGNTYLRFFEIRNPVKQYLTGLHEAAFNADCFRPVTKRATDISIFTQLLNPSKITTREDA